MGSSLLIRPSLPGRRDKELVHMTNLIIQLLSDYESDYGSGIQYAKDLVKELGLKGKIKQVLGTREMASKLERAGLQIGRGGRLSKDDHTKIKRALATTYASNPDEILANIYESILSGDVGGDEAWRLIHGYQDKLVKSGKDLTVGHHSQPLQGLMKVWEYLQGLDPELRNNVLDQYESDFDISFGEASLKHIFTLAHTPGDLTKLRRSDVAKQFGVNSLDEVNRNLSPLIKQFQAHAPDAGGTTQFNVDLNKLKGLTTVNQIVDALKPTVFAAQASAERAEEVSDALFKYGTNEDGTINKRAWVEGGLVEQHLKRLHAQKIKNPQNVNPIFRRKPQPFLFKPTIPDNELTIDNADPYDTHDSQRMSDKGFTFDTNKGWVQNYVQEGPYAGMSKESAAVAYQEDKPLRQIDSLRNVLAEGNPVTSKINAGFRTVENIQEGNYVGAALSANKALTSTTIERLPQNKNLLKGSGDEDMNQVWKSIFFPNNQLNK